MKIDNFPNRIKKQLYKKMKMPFNGINEIIYITLLKHTNVGDHMIYLGEKNFFNEINVKIRKEFNDGRSFANGFDNLSNLPIVIRGGGYFGDVWYDDYLILEKIIKKFINNKIIFMPQCIFFKDKKKLLQAKKIFDNHSDIHLFVRDSVSYDFAKKYFKKAKIYLSPDSAFFLGGTLNSSSKFYFNKKFRKGGMLYLDRNDREENLRFTPNKEIVTLDWIYIDLLSLIRPNSLRLLRRAVDLFYNKRLIITSRLHGAILASLLRKPCVLISNNYHKIKSFYDSWLKKDPLCKLINNKEELREYIENFTNF
jgi:pyruvyl transferase EpsO